MTVVTTKGREQWLLPLSGMLLVMGALLGLQVHTWRKNDPTLWQRGQAGQVLRSYQVQVNKQKDEIDQLRAQLTKYESEAANNGLPKVLNDELQSNKASLGLVPLEGPGVVLELADSVNHVSKDLGDATFVVHDYDLVQVTNVLWASGAEAIALNGQRLVAGSAVVCSGPLVQVNHETIPSPFIFTVIGDPDTLMSGLNIANGQLDGLRALGFRVKVTRQDKVQVPAIAVAPKLKFAHPAPSKASPESAAKEESK